MTWTYDSTSITTNLAKVRLLVGDTDTNDKQLTDEEINFFISNNPNIYNAAAECCTSLGAKYARQADTEVGDLAVKKNQRSKAYYDLARQLRRRSVDAEPFNAALSVADKNTYEENTDIPAAAFFVGMQEHPEKDTVSPLSEEKRSK